MNNEINKYILENLAKTIRYNPDDDGTLIGLPYKYTVPCASNMFQELYYWDTYFTNIGLIAIGNIDLAKNNTDNILYLVEKYGFMPNGNRTVFLTRSQPPFLSYMVKDVFESTQDTKWLASAYTTLEKEYNFWQSDRILNNGLNAYTGYDIDENNIDSLVSYGLSRIGYKPKILTQEIKETVFLAIRSFCESGWDCNSRFLEKPHEFNSVDLNSLLYGMESNMHYFSVILSNGDCELWKERMEQRKLNMQKLWDENKEIFTDYNPYTKRHSSYISVASFYPLFSKVATPLQASKTFGILNKLELEYGISAGEANPAWNCQWDYPNIWAPLQFITYIGLMNYGYKEKARAIAKKYISLIESNFKETNNLWEKYSGLTGNNVNAEYEAPKMLGWTAGIYIYFCKELNI